MGPSESTIKLVTEPVNHLIGNCGHIDCESKCAGCFEIEIDTTQTVNALPVLQPEDSSRESSDSIRSNVILIVEKPNEHEHK